MISDSKKIKRGDMMERNVVDVYSFSLGGQIQLLQGDDRWNGPVWPLMILIRLKAASWFYTVSCLINTEA